MISVVMLITYSALLCITYAFVFLPLKAIHDARVLYSICLLFFVTSSSLYHYLGDESSLKKYYVLKEINKFDEDFSNAKRSRITFNKEDLKNTLEHLEFSSEDCAVCMFHLSEFYLKVGVVNRGAMLAKKAYLLDTDNDELFLHYVNSLLYFTEINLDEHHSRLYEMYKNDSNNTVLLNFLSLYHYRKKEFSMSIKYWDELLPLLGDNTELKASIVNARKKAKKDLSLLNSL